MPLLAVTLFLGAALLFVVQPLVGKLVLPLLGGSPGVWNTCMVFFQAGLLAGYGYAHALSRARFPLQGIIHIALLVLVFWILPIHLPLHAESPPKGFPGFWLLGVLVLAVGLPFVVVSATAPLLQGWSAYRDARRDPYALYAASNAGSMCGLLAYPFLIEPNLTLDEQTTWWTWGYGGLIALTALAALWSSRRASEVTSGTRASSVSPRGRVAGPPVTLGMRLRWLLLAFAPSSLMLSVTTVITTDLAAVPLLWALPLAIYLLSFILTFAQRPLLSPTVWRRGMPIVVLILVLAWVVEATEPPALLVLLHLAGLFWLSMLCHGELANTRPPTAHLTEFYLWLATGGVVGGMFNALAAPLLFRGIVEYPLVLLLICVLSRPLKLHFAAGRTAALADLYLPVGLGLLVLLLSLGATAWEIPAGQLRAAAVFALPVLIWYTFQERPLRFALGLAALLIAAAFLPGIHGPVDLRVRSFFGIHKVTSDGEFRYLVHGNTFHGQQSLDLTRQAEPLTYYHRAGPMGRVFEYFQGDPRLQRVGLIGLGTGALACYAQPGNHWTFFEIDPDAIYLARDSGMFTYLTKSQGKIDIVSGDARLTLAKYPDRFGLIVVDAFSSDSIPMHLLTLEALAVYRSKLTDDGILAFHISNRFLNLEPVLANLAGASAPPMMCLSREDIRSEAEKQQGRWSSHWVVLLSRESDAARFNAWQRVPPDPKSRVWTEQFTNLLQALR